MSIPTSFIDQLLDQTDIVDVVGRRIPVNKKGSNFWCQCPFHDDSNPSMAVNQEKQFFLLFCLPRIWQCYPLYQALRKFRIC